MTIESELAPRARIVCVCSDEQALTELTMSFNAAGFALQSADKAQYADLAVIDFRGKNIAGKKAIAIANLLRRKSPECALFFIIDEKLDRAGRVALKRYGEIVCLGEAVEPLIERCRSMIRLRNIAEETGERLKSLAALSRLVEFPSIATSNAAPKILIAGHPSGAALSVINAVGQIAEQCVCVLSVGQAMRALENSSFDCAVFLPNDENDPLFSLARALRRHPRHSTLTVLHVARDLTQAALFTKRGARDTTLDTHIADDVADKIQLMARRSRLTRSMRGFLKACAGEGVRDGSSSAFTSIFLAEHGVRICARADQTLRPLTAVAIKLSTDHNDPPENEPGRRALHQATRLINRVTRAEDVVARIATDTFLILMPATNEDAAHNIAMRIEGVLESTVFRGVKDGDIFAIRVQTAAFARPAGLCIEETVATTLRLLREAEPDAVTRPRRRYPK